MERFNSHSAAETKKLGSELAGRFVGGEIVCLQGDLGAGKTTFTKGFAEALGIQKDITSPTFTLMNIYQVQNAKSKVNKLVHIDTYRLKDENELKMIGVADFLGEPGILTLVEWPEKMTGLLQNKKVVTISINHLVGDEREITIG